MAKDNARRLLVRQSIVEKFRMDCWQTGQFFSPDVICPALTAFFGFGLDFCAVAPVLRVSPCHRPGAPAAARDVSPFLGRRCFGSLRSARVLVESSLGCWFVPSPRGMVPAALAALGFGLTPLARFGLGIDRRGAECKHEACCAPRMVELIFMKFLLWLC